MSKFDQKITAEDEAFVDQAGKLLRDGAESLDGRTLSQLNRARQKALLELQRRGSVRQRLADQWVPAAAVAMLALLTVAIWTGTRIDSGSVTDGQQRFITAVTEEDALTDLDVLLTDVNLEMIEDLELFSLTDADWSSEQFQAALDGTG